MERCCECLFPVMAAAGAVHGRRSGHPVLATVFAPGHHLFASLTNAMFATGFDHILYGWIFFAIVIALLMAAGWRFFDRGPGDRGRPGTAAVPRRPCASRRPVDCRGRRRQYRRKAAYMVSAVLRPAARHRPISRCPPSGWEPVPASHVRPWARIIAAPISCVLALSGRRGAGVDLAIAIFSTSASGSETSVTARARWPGKRLGVDRQRPRSACGRMDRIALSGLCAKSQTFYRVGGC